ncbi:MAG: hypothetical protein WC254_07260 [Candidatus Woesearchaeota archaeon]|jgi:hypothetical protein
MSLDVCLDDWGPDAIRFLERRRFSPFATEEDEKEKSIFARIDEEKEILTLFATREDIRFLRENGDILRQLGCMDMPVTPTMNRALETIYRNDNERIQAVTEGWKGGINATYDGFMMWFDERSVLIRQLFRHRRLLPEQRELMRFMQDEVSDKPLTSLYHWISSRRTEEILPPEDIAKEYLKFQWAQVWQRVNAPFEATRPTLLTARAWQETYETVINATYTSKLYYDLIDYFWEMAALTFEAAPDSSRKFLGGALYTTILDGEKASCLKPLVAAELSDIVRINDIFKSEDFIRFDPTRTVGYFV